MKKLLPLFFLLPLFTFSQEYYPEMKGDFSINFYDVVKAGETYFESKGKGKGSGYKPFLRWVAENESKYYPDGIRDRVSPYFAAEAYQAFQSQSHVQTRLFDGGWEDLGPYAANNITRGYNPGIGRVEAFWVNPNNPQQIYMGSRSGGFWKTLNEGQTWTQTTDFLFASGVNTIAVSPTNPDSILINVRNGGNSISHGIYRSTDGGSTWSLSTFNPGTIGWGGLGGYGFIYKILYHPSIPDLVFIGTSEGIYRSTDNLATWTRALPDARITDIEFHPTKPNILYLYDNDYSSNFADNILFSTDLGNSYTSSGLLSGNNGSEVHIATSPSSPDEVYAASRNGVWKSTNKGQNFNFLTNPNESCDGFAVSDLSTQNMIYGYLNLHASTNGGQSFNQVAYWAINRVMGTDYVHADLRTAECLNGVFYVGTDGYLAKSSNNGQSWTRLNDGTGIRENYRIGLSQSNWKVQMLGSQDNGTSIRNENGWLEWNGGDGMEALIHPLNEQWMMGSWQFGSRNLTKDGGQNRVVLGNPSSGSGNADWIAPLLMDPLDHMKIYHFSDSIFYSNAFGNDWALLSAPGIGIIKLAAISYNNPDFMAICRNNNLQVSTDGGKNFQRKVLGLPGHSISGICFDPKHDSTLIITYNRYLNDGQKVFISHDLGDSWTNITYNLGDMPLRTVAVDHSTQRNIFVGGEIGIYTMPVGGNRWTLYNQDLPNVTINDLEIHQGSNVLRAATWGRGLWEFHLPGRKDFPAILKTELSHVPTEFSPHSGQSQQVRALISYGQNLSSVFLKWSVDGIEMDQTISMSLEKDSTWKSDRPIPRIGGNAKVYFKVYAVGNHQDTSETFRFMYQHRPIEPCFSTATANDDVYISMMGLAGKLKLSGSNNYINYGNDLDIRLRQKAVYTLFVQSVSKNPDTTYGRAWIDWNANGDFDDAGEAYDLGFLVNQNASTDHSLVPLSLRVPANAALGEIKMRLITLQGAYPNSCQVGHQGETEDYVLNIEAAVPCSIAGDSLAATACNKYQFPSGKILTKSGIYQDTLFNHQGCDSINTYDLSIIPVNVLVSKDGGILKAEAKGASFQWMDCSNGFVPINGAEDSVFSPTQNGDYRVLVSQNGCTDTSACIQVRNVSNHPVEADQALTLYPNPTTGKLILETRLPHKRMTITIYNGLGQELKRHEFGNELRKEISLDGRSGIYMIRVQMDARVWMQKIIKN